MHNTLEFDGDSTSVRLSLYKTHEPIDSLSFRVYLMSSHFSTELNLISFFNFSLVLSTFNTLKIKNGTSEMKKDNNYPSGCWISLTITNTTLRINRTTIRLASPLSLSDAKFLKLGDLLFKGLIEVYNANQTPLNTPDITEAYIITDNIFLSSIAEIESWKPTPSSFISRTELKIMKKSTPRRLMSCHDCGPANYILDMVISSDPFTYRYFHWSRTDIFIYFAHYRLNIPPPGWIDRAHKNGTLILATYSIGPKEANENNQLLNDYAKFSDIFVDIMIFYNFDGYLINIEADTGNGERIRSWLNDLTTKSHRVKADSKIIYYDALNEQGNLNHQGKLNDENIGYFDNSDGILIDYSWTEQETSVSLAKNRNWDVYFGIDTFNRGYFGGGFASWSTAELANKGSICCYAPAWTWETVIRLGFDNLMLERLMWLSSYYVLKRNPQSFMKVISGLSNNTKPQCCQDCDHCIANDCCVHLTQYSYTKETINLPDIKNFKNSIKSIVGLNQDDEYSYSFAITATSSNQEDVSACYCDSNVTGPSQAEINVFQDNMVSVDWYYFLFAARNTLQFVLAETDNPNFSQGFEERVFCSYISTWFNLGLGPRLFKSGRLIKDSTWNSLQDADTLPDFSIINSILDYQYVFHGTSSLKITENSVKLFSTNFRDQNSNIKLIYKGNITLKLDNAELRTTNFIGDWTVKVYKHTGQVDEILLLNSGVSYLAGVHFFDDIPEYKLVVLSHSVKIAPIVFIENKVSVNCLIQLSKLPSFIRHVDVYIDSVFFYRGYNDIVLVPDIMSTGKDIHVMLEAEDQVGGIASEAGFTITFDEIQSANSY